MAAKAKPEKRFFLAATALTHADNLDSQKRAAICSRTNVYSARLESYMRPVRRLLAQIDARADLNPLHNPVAVS